MTKKILEELEFKKLVKHQNYLSFALTGFVLLFYFSFILILAFNPNFFSTFVFSSNISLGIVYGLSIIIISIVLTLFYVLYSNLVLDKIRKKLKK